MAKHMDVTNDHEIKNREITEASLTSVFNNRFKTYKAVVTDDVFLRNVKHNLNALTSRRRMRPSAPEGYRYKRDWYDRMSSDQLTVKFFTDNVVLCWEKQSPLSSDTRKIILAVCNEAFRETLIHYAMEEMKEHAGKTERPETNTTIPL
jgi:hypothetical protein